MFGIEIMAGGFILKIAVIKVIAPRFEETSAKIKEKMVRSPRFLHVPDCRLEVDVCFHWYQNRLY